MTQGHRNEVEDRVSIAPITEKGKKLLHRVLFSITRFYYGALIKRDSR